MLSQHESLDTYVICGNLFHFRSCLLNNFPFIQQNQDETAILSNCYGSSRYVEFLQGLGHLVQLTDIKPEETFIGGLDVNGNDGKFAYVWHDDFMQSKIILQFFCWKESGSVFFHAQPLPLLCTDLSVSKGICINVNFFILWRY